MAQPSTAITRTELGSTFMEFDLSMSRRGFIGTRVLRPRMSSVQAADVPLVPIEALLLDQPDDRAPGGSYRRGDWEWTKYSFATQERGREEAIDDRTLAIYRDLIDAEVIHAMRAMDFVMRKFETRVKTAVYDTAVWTGAPLTTAVAIKWDAYSTAVPKRNVDAAVEKVKLSGATSPNKLTMNDTQLRDLTEVDSIIERIKYDSMDDPKRITSTFLAALFMLEEILVADYVLKNTANPAQAASIANVWDNDKVMLGRMAVTDDPAEVCIGRTIMFTEETAGPGTDEGIAVTMEEYREESVRGGVIRARTDYTQKIIYKEAGHLLTNIK